MSKISSPFHKLINSKSKLTELFYRSLDLSLIRSELQEKRHLTAAWSCSGEGRHFRCYRYVQPGALDLAILLAKPAFLDSDVTLRTEWGLDLRRLHRLDHPMVPPLDLIEDQAFLAYVQPFCKEVIKLTPDLKVGLFDLDNQELVYFSNSDCCDKL